VSFLFAAAAWWIGRRALGLAEPAGRRGRRGDRPRAGGRRRARVGAEPVRGDRDRGLPVNAWLLASLTPVPRWGGLVLVAFGAIPPCS